MAVEEGHVKVFWVDDGNRADSKNGPGRFRGAGLVALNPQPNWEGAGSPDFRSKPSSNRHPRDGAGRDDGGDWWRQGGASGRMTAIR